MSSSGGDHREPASKRRRTVTGSTENVSIIHDIIEFDDSSEVDDSHKKDFIKKLNTFRSQAKLESQSKQKTLNIDTSCILKEIGHKILRNKKIRDDYYKKIIYHFVDEKERETYIKQDGELGNGWFLLLTDYLFKMDGDFANENKTACQRYYLLNRNRIDGICGEDYYYQNLKDEHEKGEYYLSKVIVSRFFNKWQETLHNNPGERKIQIDSEWSKELWEDWGKVAESYIQFKQSLCHLCKNKNPKNNIDSQKFFVTGKEEPYHLPKAVIKDFFRDVHESKIKIYENYKNLNKPEKKHHFAKLLNDLKEERDRMEMKIYKEKGSFKTGKPFDGNECITIPNSALWNYKKNSNLDILKNLSDTMKTVFNDKTSASDKSDFLKWFKTMVKQNASALLTIAMSAELQEGKEYDSEDLKKLAIEDVEASSIVSNKMKICFYDYRELKSIVGRMKKVTDLTAKDQKILYDWLKYKITSEIISSNLQERLKRFRPDSKMSKLKEYENILNLTGVDQQSQIKDQEIPFCLPWLGKLRGKLVFEQRSEQLEPEIIEFGNSVPAIFFYDLIRNWYGIEVEELNTEEKIKFDFSELNEPN